MFATAARHANAVPVEPPRQAGEAETQKWAAGRDLRVSVWTFDRIASDHLDVPRDHPARRMAVTEDKPAKVIKPLADA